MEGDTQRAYKGGEVWRCCEEQGDGVAVSEGAHDGGEEVVERLCCDERHLHDDKHVQLRVAHGLLDAPGQGLGIGVFDTGVFVLETPVLLLIRYVTNILGRLTAYICCSRFSHQRLVLPGKSGMNGMTSTAMAMVMAPSMINSHC